MGFLGSYVHQVDAKGRVAVPAAHRKGLPPGSVVAKGPEGRLVIRPAAEWDAFVEAHRLTASTPAEERAYLRTIYASAREVELDAQGRLLLEAEHRRWAGIDQRAVFVGLGSAVEVVGEETWEGEQAGMDQAAFTALNDRVTARAAAAPATTAPSA